MPPSTFASAAAGNGNTSNHQAQSRDGAAEWARRTNGATQTFRKPSQLPSSTSSTTPSTQETTQATPATAVNPSPRYVPPHRNGANGDLRYSKDQLLGLYRAQQSLQGGLSDGLAELFVGGWHPDLANGSSNSNWTRPDGSRDVQHGPEVCWERDGSIEPLGLLEMGDEEKELFATSVNTTLKPPSQMKDSHQAGGPLNRKTSSSSGAIAGGYSLPSPSAQRNQARRRETNDAYPFPPSHAAQSATSSNIRDEQQNPSPPPSLVRRRTDIKDAAHGREVESDDKPAVNNPFNTLKRNQTGPLSAGFNAPTSPWSGTPSGAPMGSFGNFGLNSASIPSVEKRPGLAGYRAESRFKNVLNKDSTDEGRPLEAKTSLSNLSKDSEPRRSKDAESDDGEAGMPSGSAALAADSDTSPPLPRAGVRGFGTPHRSNTDDYGFGAFGMTSDNAHGFGQSFLHGRDGFQQTPSAQRINQQLAGHEPMSPTNTNPYQSPEPYGGAERAHDAEGSEDASNRLPGLGGFSQSSHAPFGGLGGLAGFPGLNRAQGSQGPQGPAGDRSQTSSAGPGHGFGPLGRLGQLGGAPTGNWPASPGGFGPPARQPSTMQSSFGGGIFGNPSSDMQSPGLNGLGAQPGIGFGGRMGGIFGGNPLQDKMRQSDRDQNEERGAVGMVDGSQEGSNSSSNEFQTEQNARISERVPSGQTDAAANLPPPPQQRTMVMPDRMRWIYRDPQGQTQGPWSGLEMHDWYKAGFFSPELLVKKYEDPEYEPLAQLIRRIGNSREPFLVPQIGIPHGPPSSSGPNAWAGGQIGNAQLAGGAQPPFASSFPSFGTTLTAEQQNALERRKQEEQYLMARQKEHLAQAQMAQRMHSHHGSGFMPGQLHHHSSAHSLHSQPSFGSMNIPGGFPAGNVGNMAGLGTSLAPGGPGFFDGNLRQPQGAGVLGAVGAGIDNLGHIREEDAANALGRLDIGSHRVGPGQFGAPGQPPIHAAQGQHQQQVQQMLQDRAALQEEQDASEPLPENENAEANDRLQEFQRLQNHDALSAAKPRLQQMTGMADAPVQDAAVSHATLERAEGRAVQNSLSLTEQVQKAASAQESPASGTPQPFPAPSQSPLPAPAAQRTGRQSFAEHLQSESRDRSQTPSLDTPSIAVAPWAKEINEAARGPSLKEIQEAEAKKAAEAEELASAARRAAFQREMEAQAAAAVAAQPGLPATASWATSGSPATPTGGVSAWAKTSTKPVGATAAKSMAQIQKEEEARKRRLAAQQASVSANAMAAVSNPAGAKSYANLAGKVGLSAAVPQQVGSAWTTVGAGGKTKTPGPVAPAATRTVSTSILSNAAAAPVRKQPQRSATLGGSGNANAQDEVRKWAVGELRPDLNKGVPVEEFVNGLFYLPLEQEMITEAVHGVSNTIDSRHFAEEFIRRKRLADKGLFDATAAPKSVSPAHAAGGAGGGWSEVAKKGPAKEIARPPAEESNGSFRVVQPKKKAGKR